MEVVDRWHARNTLSSVPPREAAHFILRFSAPSLFLRPRRGKGRAGADHLNELLRDFAPVANLCASRLGL